MIKAILFDLDGVLVDAADWHYEAFNKALNLFGYTIEKKDHLSLYNGVPTSEKLKIMTKKNGLPYELHNVIRSLKRKYTDEIVNQKCRPSHSKQIMLTHLIRKYRLACCSNAQRYSVLNMLIKSNIDSFFELIIGNDEGFQPKPSPEIYLGAFKKLKIKPHEAVIIEDTPHGIRAAQASRAKVITVKSVEDVNLSLFKFHKLI